MSAQTALSAPKLWIVLARCHRALAISLERSIADLRLCLSDFIVLEALLHKGPLTISEIQAKVLLASGSMTAAVDRVESMGLVIRNTTDKDRPAPDRTSFRWARTASRTCHVGYGRGEEKRRLYAGLRKLCHSVAATRDWPHSETKDKSRDI